MTDSDRKLFEFIGIVFSIAAVVLLAFIVAIGAVELLSQ